MKRLLFFVVGCLMVACNTTEDFDTVISNSKRFHATFADEDTRTFVDEKILLRWTEGDLISLFEGTTRNKQYKFLGETGDNAGDFEDITTGFGSGNDIDRYYAIYPYSSTTKLHEDGYITYTFPAEQNYAENSFGLGANPMVAVTGGLDDFDLCFRNAAGYLRLYLYGDDATIKSIKIEGNNSEPLAGKAYITPEFGGFPTTEMDETATTSVTLTCGEGVKVGSTAESSTPFWVVLPPTTFAEGFTLTITDTNDNEFTKSFTSNVNIQRNKYISAKIEVEFPISPNNQIIYTATAKVEPFNTYAFGAKIVSNDWNETTGEGVITFDGDVTSIGFQAFLNCDTLKSVTIPDSVTEIEQQAFHNCSSLANVTISDGVTSIGFYAFHDCDALTSITIPNSVISIGDSVFARCDSLASVTIGNGVTSIRSSAFSECYALTSITVPDSVTSIGSYAFYSCEALTSITLPNGVTEIGDNTFAGCVALTSITIPDGVTSIGRYALYCCEALTSITIPDSVTSIGNYAFDGCLSLTSITIPDSVTSIGEGVFRECDALKSFYGKYASDDNRCLICADELIAFAPAGLTTYNISDNVTRIGNEAFCYCSALTSITIPDSVTSIGDCAFWCCNSLASITIPDNVTSIGAQAFWDCNSLISITIPNSVTLIGSYAFDSCVALKSVYCKATTPPNQDGAFYDTPNLINIYVPSSSVNAYKSAWVEYAAKIVGYNF